MTTHTLTDMREASVKTEVGKIPKALIEFKDGTTIANTDDVSITTNRTSNGSTASEVVYTGDIKQTDLGDESKAQSKTNLSEIDGIKPSGTYTNYTLANLIYKIVTTDANVLTFSDITKENYYYEISNFNDTTVPNKPTFWDTTFNNDCVTVASFNNHNKPCRFLETGSSYIGNSNTGISQTSGTVDMWIYVVSSNNNSFYIRLANGAFVGPSLYTDGNGLKDSQSATDILLDYGQWYYLRIDFECGTGGYKGLAADTYTLYRNNVEVGTFNFVTGLAIVDRFQCFTNGGACDVYIDSIGYSWDASYSIGQNLNWDIDSMIKLPTTPDYPVQTFVLGGDKTIRNHIDQYCDYNYKGWYVNPSNELTINDLDVDSGFDISTTTKTWQRQATKQIEQIDQVILLCGYVSGSRIKVTSGSGNNVFKDVYAHVTDTNIAQAIADNLVSSKSSNPVRVQLWLYDSTKGMFQVGETMTINAGIKLENSSTDIPTGQYIIKSVEFNAITNESLLILEDGIVFTKEVSQSEENSQLIEQVNTRVTDSVSDTAYASSWNGVTTIAPSKNAVYDEMELHGHVASGTYTGDGAGNGANWSSLKAITGLGFDPKFVKIWDAGNAGAEHVMVECLDNFPSDAAFLYYESGGDSFHTSNSFMLRTIADGFEVNDRGSDQDPNKNGRTYYYVAIG